jgi:glutamate:GABA antiporter
MFGDHPSQITWSWKGLLPDLSSINQLVLLTGFLLGFAGMEMSAVHAKDVEHPKRDYPKAILLSTILVIALSALGSLAIAAVVPSHKLELTSGGMEAFTALFTAFRIPWAVPIMAAIITIGALGMMSTWIVGPSRGLYATALDGDLPHFFHKTNAHGMPTAIFFVQAIIVTLMSVLFLFMPSVNSSYWILVAMASELYMIMYILMFLAAIRLRYTQPHQERHYRIPGGHLGMWCVAGLGILGAAFAIIVGLFPPSQIDTGNVFSYEAILIGVTALFCIPPFVIYALRRPSWKR